MFYVLAWWFSSVCNSVRLFGCFSVRGPSVPRPFPSESPVFRQAKGPEARTNVCDLHASNSLVLAGHGNVQGTLGTIPFCKTHGMASACCVEARFSGRQSKIFIACRLTSNRTIARSIDQSINQWPCCDLVLCKDGSVTTVGTVRCSHVQPMSMAYYSSTTGQH